MRVKFLDFSQQYTEIKNEIDAGFKGVFERGDYILGKDAKEFEDEFSSYCGAKYGIGVNSGTDALFLALAALDVKAGDEVIVPTFTFIATALCVSYTGATPVFADIQDDTYNLDPKKLSKLINKKTKVILPVHLYGQPADLNEIKEIAKKNKIVVLEDACQAHGSTYEGKRVGGIGEVGCFSFYPTKSLGACGDAGMIVTSSQEVCEKAKMLRDYGRKDRYNHSIKGHNSRLDTMQAVILRAKLKRLDQWNKMRADNAAYFCELLKNTPAIKTPVIKPNRTHVFQTFAVRVPNREKVMEQMKEKGIDVLIHYPIPLHLQEAYQELKYKKGDFPVSEKVSNEIMSLPMYPHMKKEEIEYVCETLKSIVKNG